MFLLGQHVNRSGEEYPTGIIEQQYADNTFLVLWGVADNSKYTERLHFSELQAAPESQDLHSM